MPTPANLIPQRKPAREPAAGRPNDSGECKAESDLPHSTDPGLEIDPTRHGVQLKRCSPALDRLVVRFARLGFTDIYHDRVRKQGLLGQLYVLLVGTPHLGSFANGFYLRRAMGRRQFSSILDAGCGDGTFTFYVARRCPNARVLGVDVGEQGLHGEENTLEICHRVQGILQLPNLGFRKLDLRELDAADTFDFVYCFDVLEHIRENKQVLSNVYRALSKDGRFLLRIPTRAQKRILPKRFTAEHEKWAKVEHVGQHYEMDTLLADLKEIGYQVISAQYSVGFWGRLSFELLEGLRTSRLPEVVQFGAMPLLKLLRWIDTQAKLKEGDGLLVLCQK